MSVKETVDFDAFPPTSVEGKRFALSLDLGFLAVDGEVVRCEELGQHWSALGFR